MESFKINGKECEEKCRNTPNCTHFTWNGENEGTCFLKHGSVTKKDAIYANSKSIVCGIIQDSSSITHTTSSTSTSQSSIQSTTEETSFSTTDYDLYPDETTYDETDSDDEIENSASTFTTSQMSSTTKIMNTTNKSKKLDSSFLKFFNCYFIL